MSFPFSHYCFSYFAFFWKWMFLDATTSVRPSVRPSVPCYFRTTNMANFEDKKSSNDIINNNTTSEDEVVASYVPPRYLFHSNQIAKSCLTLLSDFLSDWLTWASRLSHQFSYYSAHWRNNARWWDHGSMIEAHRSRSFFILRRPFFFWRDEASLVTEWRLYQLALPPASLPRLCHFHSRRL